MTEEIFWKSNPKKLRIYAKANRIRTENEMAMRDNLAWIAFGNYYASALNLILDHTFSKHAHSEYIGKPILSDLNLNENETEYSESKEEVAVFEMKQRINMLRGQGLPESPR